MWRSLLTSSLWLSAGMIAGRLAGFVRESTLAATYGAGHDADIAILMLTVPDLLVNILVGGALSVVLIPEFRRHPGLRGAALFTQASVWVGLLFAALAAVLTFSVPLLVKAFAPGFDAVQAAQAAQALPLVLWLIPLTTLAGVTTAYLQAHDRFAVPALGTLVFNAVVAVALLTVVPAHGGDLGWLAGAVILGGLLRWLSQLARAPRVIVAARCLRLPLISRVMLTRYAQALAASSLLMLLPVATRAIASYHDPGSLAIVNYATKLVELPLGVCVSVLAVALYPRLAEAFARTDGEESGRRMVADGATLVLVVSTALAIALAWHAHDLAQAVFGVGKMQGPALAKIGVLAAIGLLSLPAQGLSQVLVTAFNARGDMRAPMIINGLAVGAFAVGGWWGFEHYGLRGLMGAFTAVLYAVAIAQGAWLHLGGAVPGLAGTLLRREALIVGGMAVAFAPVAWLGTHVELPLLARLGLAGVSSAWLMVVGIALQPRLHPLVKGLLRRGKRA